MKWFLTSPLDRILLLGAVVITILAPTQSGFTILGGVNVCVVDPLVWIFGAVLAIRMLLARDRQLVRTFPLAAAASLMLAALSVLRAEAKSNALKDLVQYVEYFAVALGLYLSVMRNDAGRRLLTKVFLGVATVIIFLTGIQYLRPGSVDDFAVRGTFGNRNVLGGYLSLCVPLSIAAAVNARTWGVRVWQTAVTCVALAVTLAGGTMLAILIAAVSVAAITRKWQVWVAWVGVFALLVMVFPRLPRANTWVIHDSFAFYTPDGEPAMRYPEWQAAAAMTADHPLRGVGLGNYQRHVGQYYGVMPSENIKAEADSQNMYLVLAGTIGIFGALAFLALLTGAMTTALRSYFLSNSASNAALAAGGFASLLAFSLNCLWAPLIVRGIGIPLAFITALALSSACKR